MKNVHLLLTDNKLSRLYFNVNDKEFQICEIEKPSTILKPNRHISITSDEEIKEGDWFMDDNNSLKTSYKLSHVQFANPKKIILTTDQDLIEDGVQAIDDEFLEWFVKNPSCEEVEIGSSFYMFSYKNSITNYYIIIPKEQPKQETTLEEFIESQPYYGTCTYEYKEGIEVGAKWQQERSYSEEDMKEAYFSAIKSTGEGWNGEYANGNNPNIEEKFTEGFDEWFEKFKKEIK